VPDGRILIGGQFSRYNGVPRSNLARLLPDGSLDLSFLLDPQWGQGTCGSIDQILRLPNGQMFISSGPTRLNSDGSVDRSFRSPYGILFPYCPALALCPDGKLILVRPPSTYAFPDEVGRLNQDGSIDGSYFGHVAISGWHSLALQTDGKLIVRSSSTVERLDPSGAPDPGFYARSSGGYGHAAILLQPNGRILLEGGSGVARLIGD